MGSDQREDQRLTQNLLEDPASERGFLLFACGKAADYRYQVVIKSLRF
jgi:hypothetical protein